MLYIKRPNKDWTVSESLYHRFLKWKLKCENILNCELAILPEAKKCNKVIVWSVDFGMDQYVSWCLPTKDLSLDVIWAKYEDFWKPQTNDIRARFDLLTSFRQGNRSFDEWYNAVQAQVSLAKYPPETASILHRDIFWFIFWRMSSLSPRPYMILILTLRSFLEVRWISLPKRSLQSQLLDISKQLQVTPKWLKLIPWGTDLPSSKSKWKQHSHKQRSKSQKRYSNEHKNQRPPFKKFDPSQAQKRRDRCSKCGDSKHVEGFKCPARKFQCMTCNKYGLFTSLCYKKQSLFKSRKPRHTSYKC